MDFTKKGAWRNVDAASPCPICGAADWCRVSGDGATALCRRNGDGAAETAKPKAARPVETANADTLHEAYAHILSELKLSAEHREALRRRGLPDAEIDRRGCRSFPLNGDREVALQLVERFGEETCRRIPGFLPANGKRKATLAGPVGLIVPCRDSAGRIVA